MFFNRSLRRKMVSGLALILVMLFILSLGGIVGLNSYRQLVADLDFSLNKAPRHTQLVDALAELFEPFLIASGETAPKIGFHPAEFHARLRQAEAEIDSYRRKLDRMPLARQSVIPQLVGEIDRGLARLKQMPPSQPGGTISRETLHRMLRQVAHLQSLASQIPDPQEGLAAPLKQARAVYRGLFWMVLAVSAFAVLLFGGLLWCGYRWIFDPIQQLHQGACRVAQGDFDYRLQLASRDEMGELAEAFNKMTARFQEITQDLDRQVRERSKQLVRSERLAGVGFLAAGVAHEINNPLSSIAMAAESLESRVHSPESGERKSESGKPKAESGVHPAEGGVPKAENTRLSTLDSEVLRQYLGMIQREAFRCQEITGRLLDFSRSQQTTRSREDLKQLVEEVLCLVGHMSKFRDRTLIFNRDEPCYAEVNGTEIKQVILNLVANALGATESGGRVEIDLAESTDQVFLTIRDDGCGMSGEVIEHLFEPFYTQKQAGGGTGLGLSISHRIVNDHGGTIEASSDGPGRGSLFCVHLPREASRGEQAA